MNYLQAQLLQVSHPIEHNGRKGNIARRVFDERGLTSHVAIDWQDTKERTGLIDVRDMSAVEFVKSE